MQELVCMLTHLLSAQHRWLLLASSLFPFFDAFVAFFHDQRGGEGRLGALEGHTGGHSKDGLGGLMHEQSVRTEARGDEIRDEIATKTRLSE
jgi:hypothetical protein